MVAPQEKPTTPTREQMHAQISSPEGLLRTRNLAIAVFILSEAALIQSRRVQEEAINEAFAVRDAFAVAIQTPMDGPIRVAPTPGVHEEQQLQTTEAGFLGIAYAGAMQRALVEEGLPEGRERRLELVNQARDVLDAANQAAAGGDTALRDQLLHIANGQWHVIADFELGQTAEELSVTPWDQAKRILSSGGKLSDEHVDHLLSSAKRSVPLAMALLKAVPLPFIAEGVREVVKDLEENPAVVLAHLRDLYSADFQGQAQNIDYILGQVVTIAEQHGIRFADRDEQLIFVNALATQIALESFGALALPGTQSADSAPIPQEVASMMRVVQLAGFLDSRQSANTSAIKSQGPSGRRSQ